MSNDRSNYEYQVGGSLSNDAPTYVIREADEQIYQALLRGEFCYVFNCRQMGKSSLRIRVKNRLQSQGYACASLDMTNIGSQTISPQVWYKSIASELWRGFNLIGKVKFKSWWQTERDMPPLQQLIRFISDVILPNLPAEKIFIFIDEIDSVLSINFPTDDFFAGIRYLYNARAENLEFNRLSFALFGVVTPAELIHDRMRTPFNIGRAIPLTGFTVTEASPLLGGLVGYFQTPETVLAAILDWTGGQPFLSQKLCKLAVEYLQTEEGQASCQVPWQETQWVAELVEQTILANWESQDEPQHLRTIRDRLLRKEKTASNLLSLYREILQYGFIAADESPEQRELLLTGLVVKKDNKLVSHNRIYQRIFHRAWVEQQLENLCPFASLLRLWLESDCQDNGLLLGGKSLLEAKAWANKHRLNQEQYQFLLASQVREEEILRKNLELDRLKTVEIRLAQEQKLAKLQKFLITAISTGLTLTTILSLAVYWQYRQAVQQSIVGHITSSESLFNSQQNFPALIEALAAKEKANKIIGLTKNIEKKVDFALEQAVYNIRNQNTFTGHQDIVLAVSFSPDGQTIASASADNTVKLWQKNGQLLASLTGHNDTVMDVAFSADGQIIISGSKDGTVKLWNKQGKLLQTLLGHQGSVENVAAAPHKPLFASASEDHTVKLWNRQGRILQVLRGHQAEVIIVVFSQDGQTIATGDRAGIVKLWDTQGNPIRSFTAHNSPVRGIDFSQAQQIIVTGGDDRVAKIWTKDGRLQKTLSGYKAPVTDVKVSPDGQLIAVSSWDGTVKIWYPNGTLYQLLQGHQGRVWKLAWSPDSTNLITAGWDNVIKLWKIDQPLVRNFYGHETTVIGVAFQPQGKYIVSASDDHTAKLWRLDGTLVTNFQAHQAEVYAVAFSPDGKLIASAGLDRIIKIWQLDGQVIASLKGHTSPVNTLAFTKDGKTLISAGVDRTIRFWQIDRQANKIKFTQTFKLFSHTASVQDIDISSDGQLVASVSHDRSLKLWQRNGQLITNVIADSAGIRAVAISPDQKIIASAGKDKDIKLWTKQGKLINVLRGHQAIILDVKFSPDSQLIASSSADKTIKIWHKTGELITTLRGHQGRVWQIAFSPDSQQIVSVAEDNLVKVWDLRRILAIKEPQSYARSWLSDYFKNLDKK
ncbi:MAG: hypothetical protein D6756_14485 [Cyanobacteria bacterium J083]|nr:MAG: hypothetical protein D6756_14485 [Cyanobacteria bacterium J083]